AIDLIYQDALGRETRVHCGGDGGDMKELVLDPGDVSQRRPPETISSVRGTHGKFVEWLEITTSNGRIVSWGTQHNPTTTFDYSFRAPYQIVGLQLRSHTFVDALGVLVRRCPVSQIDTKRCSDGTR